MRRFNQEERDEIIMTFKPICLLSVLTFYILFILSKAFRPGFSDFTNLFNFGGIDFFSFSDKKELNIYKMAFFYTDVLVTTILLCLLALFLAYFSFFIIPRLFNLSKTVINEKVLLAKEEESFSYNFSESYIAPVLNLSVKQNS